MNTVPAKQVAVQQKETLADRISRLERENAALKAKIATLPEPFMVLPNGDLWRGVNPNRERPDNMRAEGPRPVDDAMAQVLRAAKGSIQLTCLWCGQQFVGEKVMREHLNEFHKMATKGPTVEEAALAAMEIDRQNAELQRKFDQTK